MSIVDASPTPGRINRVDSWRMELWAVAGILGILPFIYGQTVATLWDTWLHSAPYGHGFLVLPISLYLVWERRVEIIRIPPKPAVIGLGGLGILSFGWFIARVAGVEVGMQLMLVALPAGVVLTFLGWPALRLLLFPIAYLVLAVPVWSVLIPVLQMNTALMATWALQNMNIPVLLEGYYLSIPEGRFVVEEVCAGLRFLLATMSVGGLYAYLNFRALWRGVLFFAVSIVCAVVFNWVRVTIIVAAGHYGGMQHWLVRDHITFGWFVFAATLVPLFLFGAWLAEKDWEEKLPAPEFPHSRYGSGGIAGLAVLALLVASLGPAVAYWREAGGISTDNIQLSLPGAAGSWRASERGTLDWKPRYGGADGEMRGAYHREAAIAQLYLAYYASQRQGKELVNDTNALYDGTAWRRGARREGMIALGNGESLTVRETELKSTRGRGIRLIWHWYYAGGRLTSSDYEAKLLQVWGLLSGQPAAAVMALSTGVHGDREAARKILRDAGAVLVPALARILHQSVSGSEVKH